jgi:hypothetical protein
MSTAMKDLAIFVLLLLIAVAAFLDIWLTWRRVYGRQRQPQDNQRLVDTIASRHATSDRMQQRDADLLHRLDRLEVGIDRQMRRVDTALDWIKRAQKALGVEPDTAENGFVIGRIEALDARVSERDAHYLDRLGTVENEVRDLVRRLATSDPYAGVGLGETLARLKSRLSAVEGALGGDGHSVLTDMRDRIKQIDQDGYDLRAALAVSCHEDKSGKRVMSVPHIDRACAVAGSVNRLLGLHECDRGRIESEVLTALQAKVATLLTELDDHRLDLLEQGVAKLRNRLDERIDALDEHVKGILNRIPGKGSTVPSSSIDAAWAEAQKPVKFNTIDSGVVEGEGYFAKAPTGIVTFAEAIAYLAGRAGTYAVRGAWRAGDGMKLVLRRALPPQPIGAYPIIECGEDCNVAEFVPRVEDIAATDWIIERYAEPVSS